MLISRILQVLIAFGGVYVLFTLVLAGYKYISAGGNSSAINEAWGMIWQSFIGLVILTGSILIISIFSWIITGNPSTFLFLQIPEAQ